MHAFGISLARLKIQVSDDTHAFWISWARPKIPVKWRSWRPTDRPYENFKINQTPASSQFEKKNSATYEAHQTWVDRTPEIVTKLFFMAPTIACFLSFSHVLYLNTPSQLFILRPLFCFFCFEKLICIWLFSYRNSPARKPRWHLQEEMYVKNSTPWNWAWQ